MALASFDDGDLQDFLCLSRAATTFFRDQDKLTDNIFSDLTSKIRKCEYLDSSCKTLNPEPKNTLLLLYVNVRSLHKNFDLFYEFIDSLNQPPHIICLSETRIKHEPLINIELNNYSFIHANSKTNAGGVAMYIHDSVKFEVSPEQYELANAESLWISVFDDNQAPFYIVGIIYRHPTTSDVDLFIEELSTCLTKFSNNNSTFYILGDLNINSSSINRSPSAKRFLNMLLSCGAFPLITKPTRITDNSATILDHIITNDYEHCIIPGIVKTIEISDHYPILCQIDAIRSSRKSESRQSFYRDKSKFYPNVFNDNMNNNLNDFFIQLPSITNENFNEIFNMFVDQIWQVVNKHAPLKKVSRKHKRLQKKPWLTTDLLSSINMKRKLYKTHFLNGNPEQKIFYKKFANKLTKMKTRAKHLYYEKELLNHSGNEKKNWETLKSLLPNTDTSKKMFNGQNYDPTKLFQKANQFNNFFCSVGEDLAKKVSLFQTVDYSLYLRHRVPNSIFFEPPTVNEIIACIGSLNANKAVGYDNIPAYFLKVAAPIIAPYLCFLIDYAFLNGIFPDNCKIAKVIPIHKKEKKKIIQATLGRSQF